MWLLLPIMHHCGLARKTVWCAASVPQRPPLRTSALTSFRERVNVCKQTNKQTHKHIDVISKVNANVVVFVVYFWGRSHFTALSMFLLEMNVASFTFQTFCETQELLSGFTRRPRCCARSVGRRGSRGFGPGQLWSYGNVLIRRLSKMPRLPPAFDSL